MTAIFAYASGDVAFVAGDSLRAIPMFGVVTAKKVHQWSETVLLAQAGDGKFQSELVESLKTARPLLAHAHPTMPDDQRLLVGFTGMWPSHYARALKSVQKLKSGAAHISGTILVAAASDAFGLARIHKLDFATGTHTTIATDVIADGTDPSQFTSIARSLMQTMRPPSSPFPIDEWGVQCVAQCAVSHPKQVGWPADVMLTRPANGGRILVYRRVASFSSFSSSPEFIV